LLLRQLTALGKLLRFAALPQFRRTKLIYNKQAY
jgi:hypothetical protein